MRNAFIPAWLDDLNLGVYEFRFYCHVLRRGELYATNATICKTCGIEKRKVSQAIASLEQRKLIQVSRQRGMTNRITALQPSANMSLPPSANMHHLPSANMSQGVVQICTTKDTPIKDTPIKEIKEKPSFSFPFDSEAFKTTWQTWEDERKERRKPLSKRAIILQIGKMKGFTEREVIAAINDAIEKRWASFFPKKEITTNQPRPIHTTEKPRSIYD
jgi:hypothetical protein